MEVIDKSVGKYYETNDPKAIVCHVDLGTRRGTIDTLQNQKQASYHVYAPRNQNEIIVFAPIDKGAWHAGRVNKPASNALAVFGDDIDKVNTHSIGVCYEGAPIDKNGEVTFDYSKVVDGLPPTEDQVKRIAGYLKGNTGGAHILLPVVSHQDIAADKPPVVEKFVRMLQAELNGEKPDQKKAEKLKAQIRKIKAQIIRLLRGKIRKLEKKLKSLE